MIEPAPFIWPIAGSIMVAILFFGPLICASCCAAPRCAKPAVSGWLSSCARVEAICPISLSRETCGNSPCNSSSRRSVAWRSVMSRMSPRIAARSHKRPHRRPLKRERGSVLRGPAGERCPGNGREQVVCAWSSAFFLSTAISRILAGCDAASLRLHKKELSQQRCLQGACNLIEHKERHRQRGIIYQWYRLRRCPAGR